MKYAGAIFDLDGVLVDTAKYHYMAWKRLAEELGFCFTEQDNERLKGVSRMKSLEILLEVGGIIVSEEQLLQMSAKKNAWYVEYLEEMKGDELLIGSSELLDELRARNVKIALGSASKNAGLVLNKLNIWDKFDAVIDGTWTSHAKPDPEVFLLGAHALGLKPEECIVFEDSLAGIKAAREGRMGIVGVGSSAILPGADFYVRALNEVPVEQIFIKKRF